MILHCSWLYQISCCSEPCDEAVEGITLIRYIKAVTIYDLLANATGSVFFLPSV